VCIWLATACCANTHDESIGLNFPQLAKLPGQPTPTDFSGSVTNDPSLDGQCWFNMVNNPVIASGYPIPKREDPSQQQGLEVSLGLMAALSHADWVTNFGSKLLLKGTISALVPIAEVGMSIVWHFLINASMSTVLTPVAWIRPKLTFCRPRVDKLPTSLCCSHRHAPSDLLGLGIPTALCWYMGTECAYPRRKRPGCHL
jgi:hypothetical protein